LNWFTALRLLLLILCTTTFGLAQSTYAGINGVVFDPSGKVIADADIEIVNEATGLQYSGKTMLVAAFDLTERNRSKMTPQDSENKYRVLYEDAAEANWLMEGNRFQRLKAQSMLGGTP